MPRECQILEPLSSVTENIHQVPFNHPPPMMFNPPLLHPYVIHVSTVSTVGPSLCLSGSRGEYIFAAIDCYFKTSLESTQSGLSQQQRLLSCSFHTLWGSFRPGVLSALPERKATDKSPRTKELTPTNRWTNGPKLGVLFYLH